MMSKLSYPEPWFGQANSMYSIALSPMQVPVECTSPPGATLCPVLVSDRGAVRMYTSALWMHLYVCTGGGREGKWVVERETD